MPRAVGECKFLPIPASMETIPLVSIVVPTFNRLARLKRCVRAVREDVAVACELIVVDGGSLDGTGDWLAQDRGLTVILEPGREGAVRAFNKGFRAARGRYVMWLNDDAFPLAGSVEAAVGMIESHPAIGLVGFYHDWDRERNVLDSVERDGRTFRFYNVRGYPYANFGLIRRELLEQLGYADERYYFFAFDPDISLKVQLKAGLKVVGCRDALIHHEEHRDDRKLTDLKVGVEDNAKLFAKWNLPEPDTYPDPIPAYRQTLRKLGLPYGDACILNPASAS